MTKQTALDLDELFGTKDPVIVIYLEKRYELARPDAWTPEQYAQYIKLQKRINVSEIEGAMEDGAAFEKLADAMSKILGIISPELAALNLSMEKKSAIINHYARVVFPQELEKANAKAKNLTGA